MRVIQTGCRVFCTGGIVRYGFRVQVNGIQEFQKSGFYPHIIHCLSRLRSAKKFGSNYILFPTRRVRQSIVSRAPVLRNSKAWKRLNITGR
jgi:hypothetical protein